MVEIVKSLKLAYVPVRKVGNTSVRRVLRDLADGPGDYVSTWDMPMSAYVRLRSRGCRKIAVVRDPVKRFLSAYGNRVVHYGDLRDHLHDWLPLRLAGLTLTPDVDEFSRKFRWYYLLNDKIRRHFRPQWRYLGRDLGWYDRIYRIEELDVLASDLSELAGREIRMPRLRTGGPKLTFSELLPETKERVLALTANDYTVLGDYYSPPA